MRQKEAVEMKKNPASEVTEEGNVDKIRDIIFGSQMRDYERRFARLEESLRKEAADLRAETAKRLDALETFVKDEFEALSNRLTSEKESRAENLQKLNDNLRETSQNLEKKISQLSEQTAEKNSELRRHILDQSKNLNEEIQRKHGEISDLLKRESEEIRDDKADRAMLAQLFQEMALRLTDSFSLPKGD